MKMQKKIIRSFGLIILLVTVLFTINIGEATKLNAPIKLKTSSIVINGNAELSNYTGTGTINDPKIIDVGELVVDSTSVDGVSISNTDLYINITGVSIEGGNNGIYLERANNVFIQGLKIFNNYEHGIQFFHSNNTLVEDNEIYDNGSGCLPRTNLGLDQIRLLSHMGSGVHYDPSENSLIRGNNIYNNWVDGITIEDGKNITIVNNDIDNNGGKCESSPSLSLKSNLRLGFGINILTGDAINIINNRFNSNVYYGVVIHSTGTNVDIMDNNFLGNNLSPSEIIGNQQALDDSSTSTVSNNCWDDYSGSGGYQLDGTGSSVDSSPRTDCYEATSDGIVPLLSQYLAFTMIVLVLIYRKNIKI